MQSALGAANAAHAADVADHQSTHVAVVAEIGINEQLTLAQLDADKVADEQDADDDLAATLAENDAYLARDKEQVDNDLAKAQADADTFVSTATTKAGADQALAVSNAAAAAAAVTPSALQKAAMTANARLRIQQRVDAAQAYLDFINSQPTSYFEMQLVAGFDQALDTSVDFFTGWANSLTFGGYMYLLGNSNYLRYVDPNSTSFTVGSIVGSVHSAVLTIGGGAGVCQIGSAVKIARAYGTVGTINGLVRSTAKGFTQGMGSLTVFDYMALAPAAGKVLGQFNRMCFVAGTPVAVGWQQTTAILPPGDADGEPQEADAELSLIWLAGGVGLLWIGHTLSERRRRRASVVRASRSRRQTIILNEDLPEPEPLMAPFTPATTETSAVNSPVVRHQADGTLRVFSARHEEPKPVSPTIPTVAVRPKSTTREPTLSEPRRSGRWLMSTLAALLAAVCFWNALPSGLTGPTRAVATVASVPTSVEPQLMTRPIETIRPGNAVLAANPESTVALPPTEIDRETWRLVSLSMTKENGGGLDVQLLRPIDWLANEGLRLIDRTDNPHTLLPRPIIAPARDVALHDLLLGRTIILDLPELGAAGPATVTAIDACPPLDELVDGQRLVTGTFRHEAANVIDVAIDGEADSIGVTDNHPFWSADRHAFVPAGELRIGERLERADGTLTQVARITPRGGPPIPVYNFEVDAEHVYHVGTSGLLVHNACVPHGYGILNKRTGEVYKFGVSRAKNSLQASGLSNRGQSQLSTIANKYGLPRSDVESVVLAKFTNSKDIWQWEREAVGIFRDLGYPLLDNIKPVGVNPFLPVP